MSQDIISARPPPRLLHRLTGPLSCPPFLPHPTACDVPYQRMCKNEKRETESGEGGGPGVGRSATRDRDGKERGEKKNYISLACLPRLSVRSTVVSLWIWICVRSALGEYIGRATEPFSIQSVKSTSKSHTVFHQRAVDRARASFVAIRHRSEWRAPIGISHQGARLTNGDHS